MADLISLTDLENAKKDADTLASVMTGAASPGTVVNRVGNTLYTYAKIQALGTSAASDALTAANDAMQSAASAGADLWSRPVASIEDSEPSSPSTGDRVLLSASNSTHPNQVAEYFSDGWHYSGAPKDGQHIYNADTARSYRFDSSASKWNERSGKRFALSDFASLTAMATFMTALGTIPAIAIDSDVTLAANTTLPAARYQIDGGIITRGSYTLTFPAGASLDGDQRAQVFDSEASGSGAVTFTDGQWVSPYWWGALGNCDGTSGDGNDDTLAIQAAIDTGCNVRLEAGGYRITDTIVHSHGSQTIMGPARVTRNQNRLVHAILYVDGNISGLWNGSGQGFAQTLRDFCIVSLQKDADNTSIGVDYGQGASGSAAGEYALIDGVAVYYFKTGFRMGATTTDGSLTTSTWDWRLNNTRSVGCQTDYEFNDCGGQQNLATKIVGETADASYWLTGAGNRIGIRQNGGYVCYVEPRLEGTEYSFRGSGNAKTRGRAVMTMPCFEGTRFAPFNIAADFQIDVEGGYGSNQGAPSSNYMVIVNAAIGGVARGGVYIRGFQWNEFTASHVISALVNMSAYAPVKIEDLEVLTTADGTTYSHPDISSKIFLNQSGTFAPDYVGIRGSFDGASSTAREYLRSWNGERTTAQIGDGFYTPEMDGGTIQINSFRNGLLAANGGSSPFPLCTIDAPPASAGSGLIVIEGHVRYNTADNTTSFVRGMCAYTINSSGTVTLGTPDWSASGSTVTGSTLMGISVSSNKIQITMKASGTTEVNNIFMGSVRHYSILPRRIHLGSA